MESLLTLCVMGFVFGLIWAFCKIQNLSQENEDLTLMLGLSRQAQKITAQNEFIPPKEGSEKFFFYFLLQNGGCIGCWERAVDVGIQEPFFDFHPSTFEATFDMLPEPGFVYKMEGIVFKVGEKHVTLS